jgi:hypothetical protein
MARVALGLCSFLAVLVFAAAAVADAPCVGVAGVCINTAEKSCSEPVVRGKCPKGPAKVCCPAPGKVTPKEGHVKKPKK